jgi:putative lipase involved disintegration of autophagic bodies
MVKGEGQTNFCDCIVVDLTGIYNGLLENENDDYNVVVSDHSLGGALANLILLTLSVRKVMAIVPFSFPE